jgi:hypothetical protein
MEEEIKPGIAIAIIWDSFFSRLYNRYWSTTHTCVEQFSHHHASVPGPPVFTSLAQLCTLHFFFRDLVHNIYIYTCHVIDNGCKDPEKKKLLQRVQLA